MIDCSEDCFSKMACDLHIHSTASDGGFTPSQVVEHAAKIGLTCISLTDHDTLHGIAEAQEKAEEIGIPFIPGIEMTTVMEKNEIHILGYFMHNNSNLTEVMKNSKEMTISRLGKIVDLLEELGLPLCLEEVLEIAGEGSLGRPHLAQAMVRHGYVKNTQEAFERYIGSYGPAYVPPEGILPEKAYRLISEAGGISAIAHPGQPGRADMMKDNEIQTHKELGAMAIEVFHPRHDDYMVNYYMKLAGKLGMGIVGGSDCHGTYFPKILMDRKIVPDWVAEKFYAFYEKNRLS